MKCGRCGLSWDTNDPDPPACAPTIDRRAIPDRRKTRADKWATEAVRIGRRADD